MKKVLSLFLSLVMLLTITTGLDFSSYANDIEIGKYYDYLKYNYDISDYSSFVGGISPKNSLYGIISAYIDDFDNDGIKDMIVVQVNKDGNDVMFSLLLLSMNIDDTVILKDEVELFSVGNYYSNFEIFSMNGAIGIHRDFATYSAGRMIESYRKYVIKNNSIVLDKCYQHDVFPRCEIDECTEEVTGKKLSYDNYRKIVDKEFSSHTDSNYDTLAKNSDILVVRYEYGCYEYKNDPVTYTFKYTIFDKTNLINSIPIEELKICSNDNNLSVNAGKTIMIGAQVYKAGKASDDLSKLAITIENPNIASSESMRIKESTCYISILGKAEGLTYINISDSKSGYVKRIPLQVTQVHGNVYDFNSVPIVKVGSQECNFYNYNGMYIDSFPKAWTSGELKFNVYNIRMTYGIVEVHDKNGKIVNAVVIDKYSENNTGIWETVVDNSMCIYNDIKDRTLLTYKQSTGYSKKTTVSIKNMPKGGYLKVTNDVNESNILAVINLADTLMALKGAYDKGIKYSSATSKKFAENITKELISNAAKYEFIQEVGVNGEKFATKLFKKVGKELVFNKSAYSDFTSSIVEALSSLDLWDTIQSVAIKSGISVGENVFMTFSGLPGLVLKGLFTVSSAVNAICQVNHLFRTVGSGYIQLNEKISNAIVSNGVSVKYCDGSDFKEVLESYNIEIDESYVNYFKENFKTFNPKLIDFIESYEIKMLKDKKVSQPNSPVEVTITVSPQLMQFLPYLNVYHKKDDGTFEKVEITKSTLTTISFITNHFSEYCIVPLVDKSKVSIENAKIAAIPTQKYTGKQITPKPTVVLNGKTLSNGVDYNCVYEYNIAQGIAKLTIVGKNNYYGAVNIFYSIKCTHDKQTTNINKATVSKNGVIKKICNTCKAVISTSTIYYPKTISLSSTSYTYNGKVKKPSVTVKDAKGKKISSKYYTVSYSKGRKNVGKYTVTVKFKGNYSGTVKKTFTIKPKAATLSKVTAGKKAFTVKWKKQTTQTTGYQIQYSTSSKFKSAKTVTVSKNKTTSRKISKLKAKKKYYVRIRTYKTVKVNGKNTKIYSGWSKVKTVKTK